MSRAVVIGMVRRCGLGARCLGTAEFRQKPIQLIRKGLLVSLTECGRTAAHFDPTGSHGVQKIAHVQPRPHVLGRMHFAARAECMTALFDYLCGQWNIARNYEITGLEPFDNFVISDVKAARHL